MGGAGGRLISVDQVFFEDVWEREIAYASKNRQAQKQRGWSGDMGWLDVLRGNTHCFMTRRRILLRMSLARNNR